MHLPTSKADMEREREPKTSTVERVASVSVTWKWLAVSALGLFAATAGYDRASFDTRLSRLEDASKVTPTQQDIRDLRGSIEKLADKFDAFRDRIPKN